jgi:16S rRNA (adenine1518-N6/adenine1519-N6)-dimethyltransferase
MKLTSRKDVRDILAELNVHPSKAMGQNFLVEEGALNSIIQAASLEGDESVLEIGAGLGVLTEALCRHAARVTAVEKDKRLFEHLQKWFSDTPNLELVRGDILDLGINRFLEAGHSHLIANLPYSVGTRILVDAVRSDFRPQRILALLQYEVGERLVAKPGTKDYGVLSINAGLWYDVKIVRPFSKDCFWPKPQIKSALVQFVKCSAPRVELKDTTGFYAFVKLIFQQRRKQLVSVLRSAPSPLRLNVADVKGVLEELDLDPLTRPGVLSVQELGDLYNALYD